jgi:hypothetical protein
MRTGISICGVEADRQRLNALIAGRDTPQKHVWRAQISLLRAAGVGTNAVMATTGKSKPTVWRWQVRFMAQGREGLLHDKARPPGRAPVSDDRAAAIVAMTLKPPPHEATHRTARAMAGTVGIAASRPRGLDGAKDREDARPRAPSAARFQALQRSRLRREAARRRRARRRATGPCHRAERGRKIPDPSA